MIVIHLLLLLLLESSCFDHFDRLEDDVSGRARSVIWVDSHGRKAFVTLTDRLLLVGIKWFVNAVRC